MTDYVQFFFEVKLPDGRDILIFNWSLKKGSDPYGVKCICATGDYLCWKEQCDDCGMHLCEKRECNTYIAEYRMRCTRCIIKYKKK